MLLQLEVVTDFVNNCLIRIANDFFISGIPKPTRLSGLPARVADCFIAPMIPILFTSGKACQRQVVIPAIFGQANEVPLPNVGWPVLGLAIVAFTPTLARSGFTRPSKLGP